MPTKGGEFLLFVVTLSCDGPPPRPPLSNKKSNDNNRQQQKQDVKSKQ